MPLTETLTRKVGPLPAWGWCVVVVGGYIVWTIAAKRGGGNTLPEGVVTGSPLLGGGGTGGGGGGGGGSIIPTPGTPGGGGGGYTGGGGAGVIPDVIANPAQAIGNAALAAQLQATTWYNPTAGTPGTEQYNAMLNPDVKYIPPGIGQSGVELPGYTPNEARAWWENYFANPYDMRLVDPAYLPGSLVLTAEQAARAVALGQTTLPPPPAGVPLNPNLFAGSGTLAAIQEQQRLGNPYYPPFAPGISFGPGGIQIGSASGAPPTIIGNLGSGTGSAIPAPNVSVPGPTPGVDYAAAVRRMQSLVATLQAIPANQRTTAQNAALKTDLAQLAKVQALAAQQAAAAPAPQAVPKPTTNTATSSPLLTFQQWVSNVRARSPGATESSIIATATRNFTNQQIKSGQSVG